MKLLIILLVTMATSVKKSTVKKKSRKAEKTVDDLLFDFISNIKGLSDVMKKRIHQILIKEGIIDPRGIKALTQKELQALPGISESTAKTLLEEAEKKYSSAIFMSLEEREKFEREREVISTGSQALNELLGGGIPTGTFVELYGAPQSGKSQLCYSLVANVLLPRKFGGLEAGAIWLDTEGSFNSKRLKQILRYYEYSFNMTEPIKTADFKVATTRTLTQIEMALKETGRIIPLHNIKLLIIDSLMDPFRAEYGGLGDLAERQKHLNRILHVLMRLAEAYDVAVVYTNQVMANPDPFATALDKVQPVGGFVLGHASDIRIWLRRATSKIKSQYNAQNARRAMITDCAWLPMSECVFSLGPFGVCDVQDEAKHQELAIKLSLMDNNTPAIEDEGKTRFQDLEGVSQ